MTAIRIALLTACITAAAQAPVEVLPTGTRIEIRQQGAWNRGQVSEDAGPRSATIKVRVGANNEFTIVPRNTIRLAPRPASINVGDRVEWYDTGTFQYVHATVTKLGDGSYTGYYLMKDDRYSSTTYTKAENIWLLPGQESTPAAEGPLPGKYRCFAYGAPGNPPIFLGSVDLKAGGAYTATNGKDGRYTYDAAAKNIAWTGGWMQDNTFGGKVESNAKFRIARTSICSHE